jgi:hypothetical protein
VGRRALVTVTPSLGTDGRPLPPVRGSGLPQLAGPGGRPHALRALPATPPASGRPKNGAAPRARSRPTPPSAATTAAGRPRRVGLAPAWARGKGSAQAAGVARMVRDRVPGRALSDRALGAIYGHPGERRWHVGGPARLPGGHSRVQVRRPDPDSARARRRAARGASGWRTVGLFRSEGAITDPAPDGGRRHPQNGGRLLDRDRCDSCRGGSIVVGSGGCHDGCQSTPSGPAGPLRSSHTALEGP